MKYRAKFTSRFLREYKIMQRRGENMKLLNGVVDMLLSGKPLPANYKDHALKGEYEGARECHIKPNWLLVYAIKESILVLTFMRTGSHSDLFG